jgi:DNA invertase Pin-like site-specific DNA recombinase
MLALLVGYARVSTDQQDLTAQRDGLTSLGVAAHRIYVDQGLTGTNRERPGLREALVACREGDTLVVTKLDRLARSLPDARAIADDLTARQVRLNLGGPVYDPTDPVGRLLRNVVARVPKGQGEMVAAAIWTIFAQPTGPLVRAQVETIALMLEPQQPVVATMSRDAREEITAFADFLEAH